MNYLIFNRAEKNLTWGGHQFKALSGGFGKGPLPAGAYEIDGRRVVINPTKPGFRDEVTGMAWFLPIEPLFKSDRSGLGIHPDGDPPGTLGCIGLQGKDCFRFWKQWTSISMGSRPTRLYVV